MAEISFSGPVEVSPDLMLALWKSMPEIGRSGVAQLFFSRFVTAPISEAAITAGARVFFEKEKIGAAGALALREGVAERCRALGEKVVNEQAVRAIVDDEVRKASADFARSKVESLMSAIPLEALIEAATPAVEGVVKALAQQYFLKTQQGQKAIMDLVERVLQQHEEVLLTAAENVVAGAVSRRMPQRLPSAGDNGPLT